MQTILAIVIPYYKISFFKETLNSLAEQTEKRFKVYIGNDASPENPEELLKKYEGKFDFVYKKFDENLGGKSLVKQWERCIDMMEGEKWFMILGDDDFLSSNVVAKFYEKLDLINDRNINVIKYSQCYMDENGSNYTGFTNGDEFVLAYDFWKKKAKGVFRSSLSEHIFRSSAFEQIGFREYPLGWHSDDMLILDLAKNSEVYFLKNANVHVRVTQKSITGSKSLNGNKKVAAFLYYKDLFSEYADKFPKNDLLLISLNLFKNADYKWYCDENKAILLKFFRKGQIVNLVRYLYHIKK